MASLERNNLVVFQYKKCICEFEILTDKKGEVTFLEGDNLVAF